MTPGKKLAMARRYQSPALTQRDLGQKLQIDTSSVGRWEATGKIPASRIEAAARALNVTIDWLRDGTSTPPHFANARQVAPSDLAPEAGSLVRGDEVLLATWRGTMASDGDCEFFPSESPEFSAIPSFLASNNPDMHILCIASGASMFPRVKNGERLVVRLDKNPPNNALVVANRPDGANFIKVLKQNSRGALELHSINEDFLPIVRLEGWEMQGYAVAILHAYEPGQANIEWDQGRALRA